MNPGEDRIPFVVWRQERAGVTGHWDHFHVAASRDMTVLDALRRINEEPVIEGGIEVSSVALDGEGDFGVNVNGVATLAGSARVADLDAHSGSGGRHRDPSNHSTQRASIRHQEEAGQAPNGRAQEESSERRARFGAG